MRRIVLTYIFLSVIGIWGAMAQNTLNPMNNRDRFGNQIDPNTQPDNLEDSTNTEIQSLPPKLYMWKLSETLGNRTIIPAAQPASTSRAPIWWKECSAITTTWEI